MKFSGVCGKNDFLMNYGRFHGSRRASHATLSCWVMHKMVKLSLSLRLRTSSFPRKKAVVCEVTVAFT